MTDSPTAGTQFLRETPGGTLRDSATAGRPFRDRLPAARRRTRALTDSATDGGLISETPLAACDR